MVKRKHQKRGPHPSHRTATTSQASHQTESRSTRFEPHPPPANTLFLCATITLFLGWLSFLFYLALTR